MRERERESRHWIQMREKKISKRGINDPNLKADCLVVDS